ncbi:cellulose biosynthesis cyclic di-GMP-binding regulatory protein BcsB [Pelolinea submarina]|uniref:Cellulose synthase subunit n=1 Tax=Pelolinea submarina TaxID=913107 RepID=A0A347ZQC2_9CHLR|nr:cellulose biosynthesis cyclic di-GMP-binding regulatory protein BcsB [Pelolinea submarina]REG06167.1 cellulose synthase subunit [Pelolinea submarina]BBB47503.1 hypothetical protein Pelsub_P0730 [Pelolinea submarina]
MTTKKQSSKGKIVLTALLISASLLIQTYAFALAAPTVQTTQRTFTLEDFGLAGDDTYQGILVSRDYGINLPAGWVYGSPAVLTLKFSHSPTLNEKSTLAVDWNDVRLGSQALTAENASDGSLELQIPADYLVAGYNTLHVEFYMGISDEFCNDVDNPAVWAVVQRATSLKLEPTTATPKADLSVFPLPFIDASPVVTNHVTLLVPAQPGSGDLNALAAVSAKLGKLSGGWRPLEVNTMTIEAALKSKPQGNLIVIADYDRLNQILPGSTMQPGKSGGGVLFEQVSPFDSSALLLAVTGMEQADVEKAGQALTSTALIPRLSGDTAYILDVPESRSEARANSVSYSLSDLGYTDTAVYGSREQKTSFAIPLSALWQNNSAAVLDLHFIHSALLQGDRFTLTVTVNGLPVGSVVINGGDSSDRTESFQLPLSFFTTGVNYLAIQSSIQLSDDFSNDQNYCTQDNYNRAWLTVVSDTQITFPTAPDQVTANIAGFPYTYMGAGDLSQLAFVLPDAPGAADAAAMSALAVRLGEVASGDQLMPTVLSAAQADQYSDSLPYRIYIGLPLKNGAILAVNDQLPQSFDPVSGEAQAVSGLPTIDTSKIDTGIIEAFVNEKHVPTLVVSGNTEKGMLSAAAQLADAGQSVLLVGDLALTTSDTQAVSIWAQDSAQESTRLSPAAQNEQSLTVWFQPNGVLYAALAILLITLVILVLHVAVTFGKNGKDR